MSLSPSIRNSIFVALLGAIAGSSQTSPAPAAFEIADVHLSPPTFDYHKRTMGGAFFFNNELDLRRATMLNLVAIAWSTADAQVLGGPSWLDLDRFDLKAKAPPGTTQQTMRPMLQALLAERFGLVVHKGSGQVPGWTLTAGKNLQLRKSDAAEGASNCKPDAPSAGASPVITFTCTNVTMAELALRAGYLPGGYLDEGAVVADRTGLSGAWNFTLKYAPRGSRSGTLFDALEQLGLKLEPSTVSVDAVIVDRVNRTPIPNSPAVAKAFPVVPLEFEVSVVKPSASADRTLNGYVAGNDTRIQYLPGGRVNAQGTLLGVVRWVWGSGANRIIGLPPFADQDSWDIQGKAAENVEDSDTLTEMLKSLLVNRFKMEFHTEERPLMTQSLVAVKPKMKKADPNSRTGCKEGPEIPSRNDPRDANPLLSRLLTCRNTTMAQFAYFLYRGMASGYISGPVFDATGLEGGWDFSLSFSAPGQLPKPVADGSVPDPDGAISLLEAMEKQIGIKVEMQKHPVEVLVVDHLERKPTEN